jgi:hypothetical protein
MLVARQNVYLDAENIFNSSCDGAHLKQEKETYWQYNLFYTIFDPPQFSLVSPFKTSPLKLYITVYKQK